MSTPRNLGAFADNVATNGKLEVAGINATGTPSSSTVLKGDGSWSTEVGPTGPAGADGAAGAAGPTGPQGTAGADGAAGPTGPQGTAGADGAAGAAGAAGPTGPAGADGATGPVAGSANQVVYKDSSNNAAGSANLVFDGSKLSVQNLNVTASSGDEGGEILLAKPVTNTSIAGTGVTIDVYQNKLRIFEQGGTTRGVYVDFTASASGVGTALGAGSVGPTGPAGTNGSTGPTGPAGTAGADGAAGAAGPTGPAGTAGTNGTDGATGPTGPTGAIGPTGPAGEGGGGGGTVGFEQTFLLMGA